jgi:hypothetical protein
MSLRWRKNGTLLCAAGSQAELDDTYIDDRLHYLLSEILHVIEPNDDASEWYWCVDDDNLGHFVEINNAELTNEN